MKISTKGRYALRVLVDLAEHSVDRNVSIREMAERQNMSDERRMPYIAIMGTSTKSFA